MSVAIHHLRVSRTARYATLGESRRPTAIWFLCHGYGQLASDFLEAANALGGDERLLVAPEGLSRFYLDEHRKVGASWMTREDRLNEMNDYIDYLDRVNDQVLDRLETNEPLVGLLGFSQGVATAARWAARGKATIDDVVFWGSTLPPELDLHELRTTRVTLVAGDRDQFFGKDAWLAERKRLDDAGLPFEELHFEGGHRLDDETLEKLATRQRRG